MHGVRWIVLLITFIFIFNLPTGIIEISHPVSAQGEYKTPVGSDWTLDDIINDDPTAVVSTLWP